MGFIQQIAHLIGKNAAVPESALVDIFLGCFGIRLLLEGLHFTHRILRAGNDIPVLLAGIGGLNAHEDQIGLSFQSLLAQLFHDTEIIFLHIGVHRADHHGFFQRDSLYIMKISSRQCNGREGVPTAGLYTDPYILSQLVMDGRNLAFGGGNGHSSLGIHLADLTIHPLDHRFQRAVCFFENFDELFGTDVIGQRPEPFARPAGEQYNSHSRFPP